MTNGRIPTLGHDFRGRLDRLAWPVETDVGPGLRGVIAGETKVVWLDPSSGRLAYRGVPIEALAAAADFEEVAFLLITGVSANDDPAVYEAFQAEMRSSRRLPSDVTALVRDIDPQSHPTRLLRAGLSAMGCHELSVDDDLDGAAHWRALRIVGQAASLAAEVVRHRRGVATQTPTDDVSLARGVLEALTDESPHPDDVRALDLLWVLYAAHGLDAPTFTSMVVASCRADPYYNVVAGLSALWGSREGGAAEAVLAQLDELRSADEAESWVEAKLAAKEPIAGFGSRAFRTPDPRVAVLREALGAAARRKGATDLFEKARVLESAAAAALRPKGVHANVNFYAAPLYRLLGADGRLVPALSAVPRLAGQVALVREAFDDIRIHRPRSRYVGAPLRTVAERGAS